jgi:hypothetical protein
LDEIVEYLQGVNYVEDTVQVEQQEKAESNINNGVEEVLASDVLEGWYGKVCELPVEESWSQKAIRASLEGLAGKVKQKQSSPLGLESITNTENGELSAKATIKEASANTEDDLWITIAIAKQLKQQSLAIAYKFDETRSFVCCGDTLHPERLQRGSVEGEFRFFCCEPKTEWMVNFAVFNSTTYVGHIFHDMRSGLWISGSGAFLTPFIAAMKEMHLYLKDQYGVQRNQLGSSTEDIQSRANSPLEGGSRRLLFGRKSRQGAKAIGAN